MALADKTLTCVECASTFVFTVAEQEFYASKGFTHEPKRCPGCRESRKASRYSSWGGRSSRPAREMYSVVCSNCGKTTEVPFQPRGDRPVYCQDCYERVRQTRSR